MKNSNQWRPNINLDRKNLDRGKDDEKKVDLGRREILAFGATAVAGSLVAGATAGYLASKQERKNNAPTLRDTNKAWHEESLAELEKGNGEVAEAIKQQIARHLTELDWCNSHIRALESQLSPTNNEATIKINKGFKNFYRYQSDFITSEIRRLSKPILEYHKNHNLPMPPGIPLPDEIVPGQEHTSV